MKTEIILLLIFTLLVVVGVIVYYVFKSSDKPSETVKSSNAVEPSSTECIVTEPRVGGTYGAVYEPVIGCDGKHYTSTGHMLTEGVPWGTDEETGRRVP